MQFKGFVGPSYTLESVNLDAQRLVNLYPQVNETGRGKEQEVMNLLSTPGLTERADLAGGLTRGMWTATNGTLYAVSGNKIYKIASDYTVTELGTLSTNTGYVSITDNGAYVVAVDGTTGYTVDMSSDAFATISDPDFAASDKVTYQDGYLIFSEAGSGRFFYSDLDAITISSDQQTAEAFADDLVSLISDHRDLWLFGEQTIEVWYNAGQLNNVFQRIEGAFIEHGCAAAFSVAKMNNEVYWLGKNEQGDGIVYKARGYQPQRISTHAVELAIRGYATISDAIAFTYQENGHFFYCLSFPVADTTWVYDDSTGMWHERAYFTNGNYSRHRGAFHAFAYGKHFVGDYENGKIYELGKGVYTDNGEEIRRMRTAPHLSSGLRNVFYNSFQLDLEVGVGLDGASSVQGHDPQAMLQWSDDGGHNWSNEYWRTIGKIGKRRTRVIWRRLGYARDRIFRVIVTDPNKIAIVGAHFEVEPGFS